jgi:hypothetical protein
MRVFVRDAAKPRINPVGAPKAVPLGCMLAYAEDWRRDFNADIGRKKLF